MYDNSRKYRRADDIKDIMVLLFYRLFSFMPISRKLARQHYVSNISAWKHYQAKYANNKYIEHQQALSRLLYGRRYTADYNSCEVIAVYNALSALHGISENGLVREYDFPELLGVFERSGITCRGLFGTSPYAMIRFMKSHGYAVESYTKKQWERICHTESLKHFTVNNDVFIFMAYNDARSILGMIHTMCITKAANGFQVHNDYEGSKCYPTIREAVEGYKNGKSRAVFIIGVKTIF